jgi:hypothetical protein
MRSKKEIRNRKSEDIKFVVSAVTTELHDMAYLEYFDTWENNGGMQWFFDECVEITHKIMLTKGSTYLKWMKYWEGTEGNKFQCFSTITGENCFDWYHMDLARKEFKARYNKDEDATEQFAEKIANLISSFKGDRSNLEKRILHFVDKQDKHGVN